MNVSWGFVLRVVIKGVLLFGVCNGVYALAQPLEWLGGVSMYNHVASGRLRLPYGEDVGASYNVSLNTIPAMVESHVVAEAKAADEYRVLLLGDSATWGWFLPNEATLAGQLNEMEMVLPDGRRVVAYNLGYPIMSLTKDLLLLEAGLAYEPDLVVWLVTLQSLPREQQLVPPLVQGNPARVQRLNQDYSLNLEAESLPELSWEERTIVGQRRELANWWRLQWLAGAWAATGIDQAIPETIPLRQSDFEADVSWQGFEEPMPLTNEALAWEVLVAGQAMAGEVPLITINEPMFVSNGRHSDLRYNSFYPRWAYDAYREQLQAQAEAENWDYFDWWNLIPPTEFSDSPVHLTVHGSNLLAEELSQEILIRSEK